MLEKGCKKADRLVGQSRREGAKVWEKERNKERKNGRTREGGGGGVSRRIKSENHSQRFGNKTLKIKRERW